MSIVDKFEFRVFSLERWPKAWREHLPAPIAPVPFPWTESDITAQCPFNPDQPIYTTHIAFFLPAISILWWLQHQPPPERLGLDWVRNWFMDHQEDIASVEVPSTGAWVLTPREPPAASINKDVQEQLQLTPPGYTIPGPGIAVIKRIFMTAGILRPSHHTVRILLPGEHSHNHVCLEYFRYTGLRGPGLPESSDLNSDMCIYQDPGKASPTVGMDYVRIGAPSVKT